MRVSLPLALATLATGSAAAQEASPRLALQVGLGAAAIAKEETGGSQVSRAQSLAAGVRVGRRSWLLLEAGLQGTNQTPRTDDLRVVQTGSPPITDVQTVREPRMFRTATVLAGVQLPLGCEVYVRPAVGFGRHEFASYLVGPTTVERAETSREWGVAAAVALGTELRLGAWRPTVEASAAWSGGEDSSTARRFLALRLVQRLLF